LDIAGLHRRGIRFQKNKRCYYCLTP